MPSEFHLLRPYWLLALIPLLILLWWLVRRRTGADVWRRVVDPHLLSHLLEGGSVATTRVPFMLLGTGWALTVFALAGPAWERLPQPVYQTEERRVIVLDISRSMNSTDVQPSRLARARFEVLDMLERAAEGQTALLAYGAEPFIVSPLTTDAATIAAQVPNLETDLMPVHGSKRTDLALERAGELLRRAGSVDGEVILVTDGPERADSARAAARELFEEGFRVSVLGVGTEKGAPIPLPEGGFMTNEQGAILLPRLEPDLLASVSDAGGGRYVAAAADDSDLDALVPEGRGGALRSAAERDAHAEGWREEGPWLLLALLPVAALGFRRGWLSPLVVLLLATPPLPVVALGWENLWFRPDQQAARDFAAGAHAEAADRFRSPDWRAAALYEAGDYDGALQTLETLDGAEAGYNRGNALARHGDYKGAIAAYERVLSEVPGHEDARHNRDLLQRLLDAQDRQRSDAGQPQSGGSQSEANPPGEGGRREEDQREQSESGAAGGHTDSEGSPASQPQQADEGHEETAADGSAESVDSEGNGAAEQKATAGSDRERAGEEPTPASEQSGQVGAQRKAQEPSAAGSGASKEVQPPGVRASAEDEIDGAKRPGPAREQSGSAAPPRLEDLLGGQEREMHHSSAGEIEAGSREDRQAMEHMLRRVPDDPGGLLRQRFLLQHLRRSGRLP